MTHRTSRGLLLLALALTLAACAPSNAVGGGVHTPTKSGNANLALGSGASPTAHSSSPSPAARPSSVPTQAAPTQAPNSPAPARTAAPQQTQAATVFHIGIYGDQSGKPGFDPTDSAVYAGTDVVFTNYDTQPRSVVAEGGAFNSGLIAPGHSWTWVPHTPGHYNFQDGTRPYVDGQIQVYAG